MKTVLPILREKKRYLAFEVITKATQSEVAQAITNQSLKFLGEDGMSKSNLTVMNEWKDNKGIIRVNRKYVDQTKAILLLIKKIGNKDAIIRSIGVSGILKKTKAKYLA